MIITKFWTFPLSFIDLYNFNTFRMGNYLCPWMSVVLALTWRLFYLFYQQLSLSHCTRKILSLIRVFWQKRFRGFPQSPQAKVFPSLLVTDCRCCMMWTANSEITLKLNTKIHAILCACASFSEANRHTCLVSLIPDDRNSYLYLATVMHSGLYILPKCKSVHCTNIKHWWTEWIDADWQTVTTL